jgi:hypothetical protein
MHVEGRLARLATRPICAAFRPGSSPLGLRLSRAKARVGRMSEGLDFLRFRNHWRRNHAAAAAGNTALERTLAWAASQYRDLDNLRTIPVLRVLHEVRHVRMTLEPASSRSCVESRLAPLRHPGRRQNLGSRVAGQWSAQPSTKPTKRSVVSAISRPRAWLPAVLNSVACRSKVGASHNSTWTVAFK